MRKLEILNNQIVKEDNPEQKLFVTKREKPINQRKARNKNRNLRKKFKRKSNLQLTINQR